MSESTNYYMCVECADDKGGVWPDGHVATFHDGECYICKEKKVVAHHDDWNWPGQRLYPGRD